MSSRLAAGNLHRFWKGRVALYAILEALKIRPGDEVIVPGFTCVVVPQAVRFTGARPVYADVDAGTLNVDPDAMRRCLTPRTRAIIVQHTFGVPADLDAVRQVAAPRGLPVIEDCAHTMTSLYKGRPVGTLGDAAFFSTQWSKPVTTGLGGIAVSNRPDIDRALAAAARRYPLPSLRERVVLWLQVRLYRRYFSPSLYWRARGELRRLARWGIFIGSSSPDELAGRKPGDYEKRMSPFQARALKAAVGRLGAVSERRRALTRRYDDLCRSLGLNTVDRPPWTDAILLRYPVFVPDKMAAMEEARRRHVEIGDWFVSPVHPLTEGLERVGYRRGECPNGEDAAARIINLPTHPRVDEKTFERVGDFLAHVAANARG